MCQFLLDKYSLDSPLRANSSLVENDVLRSVQRALLGSSTSSKQTDGNDGTTDVDDSVLLASERCHLYHLLSYSKEAELERGVVALDFDEVCMCNVRKVGISMLKELFI